MVDVPGLFLGLKDSARTPHTRPLVPSRDTRSGLDLPGCGVSFQAIRSSRYSSHSGSYGLAALRIFFHRRTLTPAAFISRIGRALPLLSRINPVNTQSRWPSRWKYFFLIHFQLFSGWRRRHHLLSFQKIRLSTAAKMRLLTA